MSVKVPGIAVNVTPEVTLAILEDVEPVINMSKLLVVLISEGSINEVMISSAGKLFDVYELQDVKENEFELVDSVN
jgi:hypothetical protein